MIDSVDVAVIGAGQSGLSVSYYLKQRGINHAVFEAGNIGESWRSYRWDNFRLNTPNFMNILPEHCIMEGLEQEFCSAENFYSFLTDYASRQNLPVLESHKVAAIEKAEGPYRFLVTASHEDRFKQYHAKSVIVASGFQVTPKFGSTVKNVSACSILQLHSSNYKNPASLPDGNVLIIGSGQSGAQIADDILSQSSKKVFLSTSKVGRVPRRYRGRDIEEWLIGIRLYDTLVDTKTEDEIRVSQPLVSGVGKKGCTISLQSLAAKGATLFGSTGQIVNDAAQFQDNLIENIKFGDASSAQIKSEIDDFILNAQLEAPLNEIDGADLPYLGTLITASSNTLDFLSEGITSIIWATGYSRDFSFLKPIIGADQNRLRQKDGISEVEGLYFIGMPWQRTMKSGIIFGAKDDAAFIVQHLLAKIPIRLC